MTVATMPADLFVGEDCNMAKLYRTKDRAHLLHILKQRVREWADSNGVVTYKHGKHWASSKLGRLQAANGLQGFPRSIRAMLAAALYWDVDCANAQPTILLQLARKLGWTLMMACPNLERYVAERDAVLCELQTAMGLSKDDVKKAIISILFGSMQKHTHPFLAGLQGEMAHLRDCAWTRYDALQAQATARHLEKKRQRQQSAGPKAILISTVLQTEECKVLLALVEAARTDNCAFHTLIHDGALLWKEDCPNLKVLRKLLPRWEQEIAEKTGYAMTLAVKPMVQTTIPPKPVDAQKLEDERRALATRVLHGALRSNKRYGDDVALRPVRRGGRTFFAGADGAGYCRGAEANHKRVYFRLTHYAVYQECSDAKCSRRKHLVAKLTPEQSEELFPHAKLDALTEALDCVPVKKNDGAAMKAFGRAASGYLAAAQRYDVLERARDLLYACLGFFGVDVDHFRANFHVCEPDALWREVYLAAPTRGSPLITELTGQDASSAEEAVRRLAACDAPAGCRKEVINKEYLTDAELHDCEILQIKSAMGTGKSKSVLVPAMRKHLNEGASVLLVSPRVSYTTSIQEELQKEGFKVEVYLDARSVMLAPGQVSIISPQSLYKLAADGLLGLQPKMCSLLVLDECETTLQQMSPNRTQRNHLISNWTQLMRLVKQAKQVIAADAYLSNRTTRFLANVRPDATSCLVVNEYKPSKGVALKLVGNVFHVRASFKERLLQCVHAGKRVYVLCTEKTLNDEVYEMLTRAGIKVMQHTSENRNGESLGDVLHSWPQYQVVICTLCVSVGINFDPEAESDRFDQIFAYCHVSCGLVRDVLQGLMRTRKLREKSPALVYAVNIGFGAVKGVDVSSDMLVKRQQLREMAHTSTFSALNNVCAWAEAPDVVKQVDVANDLEDITYKAYYEESLDMLLQQSGFDLRDEYTDDGFAEPEQDKDKNEPVDINDVANITSDEYEGLRKTLSDGSRQLSDEEHLAMQKHLFVNCCAPGHTQESAGSCRAGCAYKRCGPCELALAPATCATWSCSKLTRRFGAS